MLRPSPALLWAAAFAQAIQMETRLKPNALESLSNGGKISKRRWSKRDEARLAEDKEKGVIEDPTMAKPDSFVLLHVGLFERWGRMHALRFGAALLRGALPRTPGYRVLTGRRVRISVTDNAGERRRQPVQIDGDDALTLPVSIGLAPRGVRVLRP